MEPNSTSLPITVIIFGASGDLTQRKLIPALYNLHRKGRLPQNVNVIGISRTPYSHEEFRKRSREGAQQFAADTFNDTAWAAFEPHIWYHPGDSTDPRDYQKLNDFAAGLEKGQANRLYYLSVAPSLYNPIIQNLAVLGAKDEAAGWRRFVIEKPFGTDLQTA